MSWAKHHKCSESAATAAHEARKLGKEAEAKLLFAQAADSEELALNFLTAVEKPKTYGITAVSAAALWFKADELERAEIVAHSALSHRELPQFSADQLRNILQAIWNQQIQKKANIKFIPGQITVAVDGGEVVRGGAPLDLVVDKVQTIQSLFYRTAEFLQNLPLRRFGAAPKQIQDLCRPWLFQSTPGSYQFTVAIEGPKQMELFPADAPDPMIVASTFMSILEAASQSPEDDLAATVPNDEYRKTFLKLARNLAPNGKEFTKMSIKSSQEDSKILLTPELRKEISKIIRANSKEEQSNDNEDVVLHGILRAVHLDKDWLELSTNGNFISVNGVGDNVDDVIGPMVNHSVIVYAKELASRKRKIRYQFVDIERD